MTRKLSPLLALSAALACAPKNEVTTDASTGSEGSGGSETSEPTDEPTEGAAVACPEHPAVDACCCFLDGGNHVSTVCEPAASPCATVDLACGDSLDGPGSPCTSAKDEAALDCALEVLAGTEAASLELSFHAEDFYWYETLRLHVQGDGTVYKIEARAVDLSEVFEPTGRFSLKPAAFFTDCLAEDLTGKAECLRAAVEGEITEMCLGEIVNQDI
jgi:hypothetical protein